MKIHHLSKLEIDNSRRVRLTSELAALPTSSRPERSMIIPSSPKCQLDFSDSMKCFKPKRLVKSFSLAAPAVSVPVATGTVAIVFARFSVVIAGVCVVACGAA